MEIYGKVGKYTGNPPKKMMCQDVLDLSCFVLDQNGMDPRSTITKKHQKVGAKIYVITGWWF